ncbi:hypothetical protein [Nocardiopsis sp. JB363]|uniref:hypothetical protein n=1 Tax=Nocardiopsis sp. JB363 TaxID=1434837 RepID=UPI00097A44DC|nr:hypothetical protein [Nocardiopsis sp. JB363]SIO88168.1 hypothetical protein BQ8420_18310 [Nocardiopsis sp. JB363]
MNTPHDIDRLERIRAVTSDFSGYQGLYTALLGLLGLWAAFVPLSGSGPWAELFPVGMLLIAGLFIVTQRYYRRRFGKVRPRWTTKRVLWVVLLPIALVCGYIALMSVTNVLGVQGGWVFGVFVGVCLVAVGCSYPRDRWHYLAGAVLVLAFSLLPLGAITPSGVHPVEWEYPVMVPLVAGLVFVVNGLLDHRTLVRTLTPVSENGTD